MLPHQKKKIVLTFETQALDNAFAANLKYITNPNPYRYKELNLSIGRVDGNI